MIAFTNILLTISSLALSALSIPLKSRDVVDPPITSPMAGTVWHVGESQLVTWNTEGLPSNPSNPVGMLVLGYMYNNSENLMLGSPLATNIDYALGQVQITVPKVETREDYIVVLFGDSGNASPEFTIINDSSSVSASVVSTTASSIQSTNPTTGSASSTFTTEIPTSSPSPCTTSSTSTGGSTLPAGTNQATLSVTSTTTPAPNTLTGGAWRNDASKASLVLGLVSLVWIL